MEDALDVAAEAVRRARHLVVFTGAGVSSESGIPTFRDDDGFWSRFPLDDFGNWRGLLRSAVKQPRRLAEFIDCVISPIAEAEPNLAHRAIAKAQGRVQRLTVATQNVDALHQRAGSETVFEVHGTLFAKSGLTSGGRGEVSLSALRRASRRVRAARRGWFPLLRLLHAVRPLLGVGWRGVYRPAIVMFGDAMAEPAWSLSQEASRHCDCFLQVGTSGMVYPAALLPDEAKQSGAVTIAVDPEPQAADIWLRGAACDVVPELFDRAFGAGGVASV